MGESVSFKTFADELTEKTCLESMDPDDGLPATFLRSSIEGVEFDPSKLVQFEPEEGEELESQMQSRG